MALDIYHPAALLFPEMTSEDFEALKKSVAENGLREPIVLDKEDRIIDGRHRFRASGKSLINLVADGYTRTVDWDDEQILAYVLDMNLARRHLTTAQRAAIAAELATMKQGTRTDLGSNDPKSGMSNADAAKALKVSPASVKRAKQQMREDPEAHERAKKGELPRKAPVKKPAAAQHDQQPIEGKDLEVADRLAAEHGVTREQIISDGQFAEAVDAVAAHEGEDAARQIRAGKRGLTLSVTITAASSATEIAATLWRTLGRRKALSVRTALTDLAKAEDDRRAYPSVIGENGQNEPHHIRDYLKRAPLKDVTPHEAEDADLRTWPGPSTRGAWLSMSRIQVSKTPQS